MVKAVATNFVPVALNTDRLSPDTDAGTFFRGLMTEWPQGLWVVTPDGKKLAFTYHQPDPKLDYDQNQKKWVDDTRAMLDKAVTAAGDLKPRAARVGNPFPDRGFGPTADGGARLAVSVIALRNSRQDGPSAADSVALTKEEWAAFAPPPNETEWVVPEAVARKFSVALSAMTDSIFVPQAKDVTEAKLTAKALRTEDGRTVIQFTGEWAAKHFRDGDPKFPISATTAGDGVGVYDPDKKEMVNLLFVLRGKYTNGRATVPTAAVVEWERDRPKE